MSRRNRTAPKLAAVSKKAKKEFFAKLQRAARQAGNEVYARLPAGKDGQGKRQWRNLYIRLPMVGTKEFMSCVERMTAHNGQESEINRQLLAYASMVVNHPDRQLTASSGRQYGLDGGIMHGDARRAVKRQRHRAGQVVHVLTT